MSMRVLIVLPIAMLLSVAPLKAQTDQPAPASDESSTPAAPPVVYRNVYMYGIAQNVTDSITYLTEIYPVEGVEFDKHSGFFNGLDLYSDQLRDYLLAKGKEGYICTTFYALKRKDAEKGFIKIKKHIDRNDATRYQPLPEFSYHHIDMSHIYRGYVQPDKDSQQSETESSGQ